jgi:hypothetical protein
MFQRQSGLPYKFLGQYKLMVDSCESLLGGASTWRAARFVCFLTKTAWLGRGAYDEQ